VDVPLSAGELVVGSRESPTFGAKWAQVGSNSSALAERRSGEWKENGPIWSSP